MEKYSLEKAQNEAEKMRNNINSGKANNYTEAENQVEEIKKIEERYIKSLNEKIDKFEILELTDDRSVKIKLKGQDETIFKSPKFIFSGGYRANLENEKKYLSSNIDINFSVEIRDAHLKIDDLSADGINALSKELNFQFILGINQFNPLNRNFLNVDWSKFHKEDDVFNIELVDKKILEISDKNISEKIRINYLFNKIITRTSSDESLQHLDDICEKDQLFAKDLLDFSVRQSIKSGHQSSQFLFKMLVKNPNFLTLLNDVHKNYSLPYLLERDLYSSYSNTKLEAKKYYEDEILAIIKALNFNLSEIQKKIDESDMPHKYLPEFQS